MAVKGYTTKLSYGSTADYGSSSWTPIARVKSIKPHKVAAKDIDTTVLDSAGEYEESVAGLANGGELELSIEYAYTQSAALYALFRITKGYELQYPGGTGWHLNGYITEFGDDEVINGDIVRTTTKIKVTGAPVQFTGS